jgi:hypothetical protein
MEAHMTRTHQGGCHCGAVRFEADLDLDQGASRCNCTLCTRRGALTAIVRPAAFRFLHGQDGLTEYTWGARNAHYRFCRTCGIHVGGTGHLEVLGGDYVSVNVSCLDGIDPATVKTVYFDGRHDNWRAGPRDRPWPIS